MAAKLIGKITNAKTRTFLIVIGTILLLGVGIVLFSFNRKTEAFADQKTTTSSIPSTVRPIPGSESSEKLKALQNKENENRAEQARKKGESAIPTVISGNDGNAEDERRRAQEAFERALRGGKDQAQNANPTGTASNNVSSPDSKLQQILAEQERKRQQDLLASQQDRQRLEQQRQQAQTREALAKMQEQAIEEYNKQMTKQAGVILQLSNDIPTQQFVQGDRTVSTTDRASTSNTKNNNTAKTNYGSLPNNNKVVIKAGTVLFGILDTSVNTDEPSPILATVVSGPYRGAKLIGSVEFNPQSTAEKVILNFTTMTLPNKPTSFPVKVVAIDPDTARTALASSVDHHYFLRYGTLFASSFMKGYGQTISQEGSVQTTAADAGSTTTTKPQLTPTKEILAALGEVGTAWGQALKDTFNRQITIRVDAGTSIGLLILGDVQADVAGNIVGTPGPNDVSTSLSNTRTTTTGEKGIASANTVNSTVKTGPATLTDSPTIVINQK